MSKANRAPQVITCAHTILKHIDLLHNPYFKALEDGSMTLKCFRRTQEQFFFAVTFFPRPMAALVGRIADPRHRIDILHNLVEEHGEFEEKAFHHTTFKQFLRTIGSQPEKLNDADLWPALRAFNSVLTASCVMDELEVAVACMGIIEYAFAGISAVIGNVVVQREWVSSEDLVHYKLHAEIDERHAEEFFAVIESSWADENRRYFIEQGLQLGAYIFDRLYRDMYTAGRRSLNPAPPPNLQDPPS